MIEQNKQEIAELKKKLEEQPTVPEPSPAVASELMDKTKVSWFECMLLAAMEWFLSIGAA